VAVRLADNALTTWDTVADECGLEPTAQDRATRLINVASDAIEGFCDRRFGRRVVTGELYDPIGSNRLLLARSPVVSIQQIVVDGTVVLAGEYEIEDAERGWLWRDHGWFVSERMVAGSASGTVIPNSSKRTIAVDYTAGWILPKDDAELAQRDLPYDLEQACIDTVASLWRQRGTDKTAARFDQLNNGIGTGQWGYLPDAAMPTLKRYARIV